MARRPGFRREHERAQPAQILGLLEDSAFMSGGALHKSHAVVDDHLRARDSGYRGLEELTYPFSVLLTFCRWSPTLMQNLCRRVVVRQRLIYYKGRSTS